MADTEPTMATKSWRILLGSRLEKAAARDEKRAEKTICGEPKRRPAITQWIMVLTAYIYYVKHHEEEKQKRSKSATVFTDVHVRRAIALAGQWVPDGPASMDGATVSHLLRVMNGTWTASSEEGYMWHLRCKEAAKHLKWLFGAAMYNSRNPDISEWRRKTVALLTAAMLEAAREEQEQRVCASDIGPVLFEDRMWSQEYDMDRPQRRLDAGKLLELINDFSDGSEFMALSCVGDWAFVDELGLAVGFSTQVGFVHEATGYTWSSISDKVLTCPLYMKPTHPIDVRHLNEELKEELKKELLADGTVAGMLLDRFSDAVTSMLYTEARVVFAQRQTEWPVV